MKKVIFMGTPQFACGILETLINSEVEVIGVVCQPDKLVGRKQVLTMCPVKELALKHNIEVIQPVKIREDYSRIKELAPDMIITCAYGQFIPKGLLELPPLGCFNVHGSLLPKLRGGAPIQHSIIDGLNETGITIMEMSEKMDAGDIISQRSIEILHSDTYGDIHDKLMRVASDLFKDTLESLLDGSYTHYAQDESLVTFGFNISKEEEHVDLNKNYIDVYNLIRGLIPNPCAYIIVDEKKIKIWSIETSDECSNHENGYLAYYGNKLGLVIDSKVLMIKEVQLEGKNKMTVKEFKNGAGRNIEGKVAK